MHYEVLPITVRGPQNRQFVEPYPEQEEATPAMNVPPALARLLQPRTTTR